MKKIILPAAAIIYTANLYGYAGERCNAIPDHNCAAWYSDMSCPSGDPFCKTEAGRNFCACEECAIYDNHGTIDQYVKDGISGTHGELKYGSLCVVKQSGGSTGGGGGTTTEYELCSDDNQCRTFSITVAGQKYCSTGGTCTPGPAGSYAASATLSKYCKDYKGVGPTTYCWAIACNNGYYRNENGICGYSCATGWYGRATGLNNKGCTRCPAVPGVYTNSTLTSALYGTTLSHGATEVSACFPSDGTYYDTNGQFQLSGATAENCGA